MSASAPKPSIISLYTGAGGLDYGLEAAGFETRVAVEMDRDCVRTLKHNRRWPVIDRDILTVPTDEILEIQPFALRSWTVYGPEIRSYAMSRIRKADTGPEIALRKALWAAGLRGWRLRRKLSGTPDIVFGLAQLALFVDGCFWHSCPRCAIRQPSMLGRLAESP